MRAERSVAVARRNVAWRDECGVAAWRGVWRHDAACNTRRPPLLPHAFLRSRAPSKPRQHPRTDLPCPVANASANTTANRVVAARGPRFGMLTTRKSGRPRHGPRGCRRLVSWLGAQPLPRGRHGATLRWHGHPPTSGVKCAGMTRSPSRQLLFRTRTRTTVAVCMTPPRHLTLVNTRLHVPVSIGTACPTQEAK